jgi:hypothetical protein
MRNQMLYRGLFNLMLTALIILTNCTSGITETEPEVETVNSSNEQATAEAAFELETGPSATDSEETAEAAPTETETVNAAGEQATAEVSPTRQELPPTATDSEGTAEAAPTETETANAAGEQATAEVTPTQPGLPPTGIPGEGLQVLVAPQDDSLSLWQDGTLNELANTAGVFAAVFVGDSGNIAYVREHEVWCMDTLTQAARQVPLPPELVSTIPYEYEAPNWIAWLMSLENNSQVVATVFHGTVAHGTILVDCDTDTSQLIESTNPGHPAMSPNGSKIAIAGSQALSVYDIASGITKVLLTFEPIGTYTEASFYPVLSWSSDATHIVTVIHPQDWWMEDVDEPSIVYRLSIESGEVEAVAHINRMFVREPHTAVAFAAEKLAYSTPSDPLAAPFAYILAKQMILDLSNGEEMLLFEGSAGFIGRNPLGAPTDFIGWNPSGDYLSFWEGSDPFNQKLGIYDINAGRQLEGRLLGTFAGWVDDTSFLYSADGTLYLATIVGTEITPLALTANIERVHQAHVFK